MIRRTVFSALAAAALVLVPAAAMAYDAPGCTTTVGDSTITAGRSVTVTTTGADPNSALTLTVTSDPASIRNDAITISGTKALTETADASGTARWNVTFAAAGTYALAVADASGTLVGDETVTVAAAGAAVSDAGFDASGLAGGAAELTAAGAIAVFLARRRQQAHAGA